MLQGSEPLDRPIDTAKWPNLALLAAVQVLALALWFSGTAIVPALKAEAALSPFAQSLFTSAVQVGFVAGTLVSAVLGLPDRWDPRALFMWAALLGASANALILAVPPDGAAVVALRFVTGIAMAGVYPVGMKLAAGWAKGDLGLMVGLLVGALTVGSAVPHLFNALGGVDWRLTIGAASLSAGAAALLIRLFRLGPNHRPAQHFDPTAVLEIWRNRGARLATLGYLGHMWELYAVWAWIGVFLAASFAAAAGGATTQTAVWAGLATFAMIAAGSIGGVGGGLIADRVGRTTLTIGAMAVSGACCVAAGLLFGAHPLLLTALCLVWGVTIVGDSAQFSASVAELSDPARVGTMLTLQTCLGFLLTLPTIHMMPGLVAALGWRWAFAPLAVGPLLGCIAMWRLRRSPDAAKLAGGRG